MKFLHISPWVIFYIDLKIKRKKKQETLVSLMQEKRPAQLEQQKQQRTKHQLPQRSNNTEKIVLNLAEL